MTKSVHPLPVILVLLYIAAMLAVVSCGSDARSVSAEPTVGGTVASQRLYTFADFEAAGFKNSKTYDVTDLPRALAAHYGFWGTDPYNRNDFEFRLYASHDDAVNFGQTLAAERVGKGAKLTEETATWKVGIRDARECHGVQGQAQHAASCLEAKYYDYMIVGNMVLLCPGNAADVARKNCEQLLAKLH